MEQLWNDDKELEKTMMISSWPTTRRRWGRR